MFKWLVEFVKSPVELIVQSDERVVFGPVVADLLIKLRKGDTNAADALWDIGSEFPPEVQRLLDKRVHAALDKQGLG